MYGNVAGRSHQWRASEYNHQPSSRGKLAEVSERLKNRHFPQKRPIGQPKLPIPPQAPFPKVHRKA
jgi:hypothetical protein